MSLPGLPFLSVIIPTYRDWNGLKSCLAGLSRQTFPAERFEIIVVDNAGEGPPADLELEGNVRVIEELRPGSYAARNRGIVDARGEVLAFLDADCQPAPGWLETTLAYMEARGADLVAGHIALNYLDSRLTPAECFEKAFAFRQAQNVEQGVAVTANLFVRRELFDAVGMFDDVLMSGGDFEWTRRATSAGFALVYCHVVVVYHPARNSLASLASKARRVSAGSMVMHGEKQLSQGGRRVLGNLLRDLGELLRRSDMTWRERWCALWVLGYLKCTKVRQRLRMQARGGQHQELPR